MFSIEVLMEKIEHVVAENKSLIVERNKNQKLFFGVFGLSPIRCMDQNKKFLNWNFSDGDLFGGMKPVVTEKYEFGYLDKSMLNSF